MALRSKLDPEQKHKQALETIVTLADHLTTHVNDLFLIARGEAGLNNFQMLEVDLAKIVSEAVDQQKSLFKLGSATLNFEMPNHSYLTRGEGQRLIQLVHILLTNAITHSPKGVCVDVTMTQNSDWVGFCVRDDGRGIPREQRETVFDFFSDISDPQHSSMLGTGLGLPIAKCIVTGHNGRIEISDCRNIGAEISVSLPRKSRMKS